MMTGITVALALAASVCFGLALVLTQFGLRHLPPVTGAAIALPSAALLFLCASPFVLHDGPTSWTAVMLFTAVGLLFPTCVTLLTYEANRRLGLVITGTLGNLAPLFAIALAFAVLGEPLRPAQLAGLVVIVSGVAILSLLRNDGTARWYSWFLLLPLAAAAVRGFTQPVIKIGLELWPSPFAATLIGNVVSGVIVVAAAKLRTGAFLALPLTRGHAWFAGVGICNGLAVMLLYAALASGPVVLVSPLVATYPLVTFALSAVIFGKANVTVWLALGVTATVAGVALLLVG